MSRRLEESGTISLRFRPSALHSTPSKSLRCVYSTQHGGHKVVSPRVATFDGHCIRPASISSPGRLCGYAKMHPSGETIKLQRFKDEVVHDSELTIRNRR